MSRQSTAIILYFFNKYSFRTIIFVYLSVFSLQFHTDLTMWNPREHIHGPSLLRPYPAFWNTARSRTSVSGLQETYTTVFGPKSAIEWINSSVLPLLGGSINTHVGRRVPGSHLVHKPAGVIAVKPDISDPGSFSRSKTASRTASRFSSTPITSFASPAAAMPMVPIPQYASITVSFPVSPAARSAV